MFLEENNTYFGTGSDTPNVMDAYSGKKRLAGIKDIENVTSVPTFESEFLVISLYSLTYAR